MANEAVVIQWRKSKLSEREMERLPEHFKKYFWDVNWEDLNRHVNQYQSFIVIRLADKGDIEQIRWLKRQVGYPAVSAIVGASRQVSPKTKQFWKNGPTLL